MGNTKVLSKGAKALTTLGLAVSLGLFGIAPGLSAANVGQAYAATTGTITINAVQGQTNAVTYDGYQIFTADVTDGTGENAGTKTAQDLKWASDNVRDAVNQAITTWATTNGKTYSNDDKNPQVAADFIQQNVDPSGAGVISGSDGLAQAIAKALLATDSGVTATVTDLAQGTASSGLSAGYYLFVTNTSSIDANKPELGTAPIYQLVGDGAVSVNEKVRIPTVDKKVAKNTSTGTEAAGDRTDAAIGDVLTFTLTGTLPSNYATYDSFKYEFSDTPSGMDIDITSIKVTVDGAEVQSSKYDASATSTSSLSVKFEDLKTAVPTATADSKVVVTYKAALNSDAAVSAAGNENDAKIKYSNNPYSNGEGETTPDKVKVFTYKLTLNKVDLGTEKALNGASFSIKNTTDGDINNGKYVQVDASGKVSEYTTNANDLAATNGVLDVTGLDAGTYQVEETVVPDGYSKVANFTFTISPEYGTDNTLTKVTTTVNGTNVIPGSTDGKAGDNTLTTQTGTDVTNDGTVTVTVGDQKKVGLPLTGQAGVTMTFIAGGAVLALTIGYAVRNRRRAEEE